MRLPDLGKSILLVTAVVCAAAIFSACSSADDKAGGTATAAPSPSAVKIDISNVPELKDGTLTIGSDIAYPPIESYKEGTQEAVGMDVDLANALAQKLGVKVEFKQVASFAGIVGDLQAKRYDIVMSAISITPERQAQIDFVPYFGPVGTGILTAKGNPKGFKVLEDLCGHPVAAQDGTYQVDQMKALNEGACKAKNIDIRTFPDNPSAVQELKLGRVDAELADDPVAKYSEVQSGGGIIVLAVTGFESAPYGIGTRKDSTGLQTAIEQAFKAIRDDGTYLTVLRKWDQEQFALK